jgi:hypothetical protein
MMPESGCLPGSKLYFREFFYVVGYGADGDSENLMLKIIRLEDCNSAHCGRFEMRILPSSQPCCLCEFGVTKPKNFGFRISSSSGSVICLIIIIERAAAYPACLAITLRLYGQADVYSLES